MFIITEINSGDWKDVSEIFVQGIVGGNATFATSPPDTFEEWMDGKNGVCCVIARDAETGAALGWACLSPTSKRPVFSGVQELSIYIANSAQGKGLGKSLIDDVIVRSERENIWTIQSGVFPENDASLALHKKMGFRVVGSRERVGKMENGPYTGVWRDIILLERRSNVTGI